MAVNNTIAVPANTWTAVNTTSVSSLRVQNTGTFSVDLQATSTAVAPSSAAGAISLDSGQMIAADITLNNLYPGISGAGYIWAYSTNATTVSVSHA